MFFNRNKDKSKRILLGVMVFVLTYGLLVTSIAPRKYNLEEGDIATVDIKAPRDTVDEVSTKEREKEIIEKIGKQYTLNGDVKIKAEENIKKLFDKISNINSTDMDEKEKILSIKKVEEFNLNDSEYKTLISVSKEQLTLAHWFVLDTLNLAYGEPIEENNLEHIQKAKSIVDNEFRKQSFDRNLEDVLKDIIYSQIKPNFFFDKEKTDEKIREAQKNVPKEIIKKNQTIVKEGEPITARQIELLKELGLLDRGGGKNYLYTYIVLAIFVIVVLLLEYSYISKERKDLFEDTKMMTMISMINLIILVLSRGLSIISPFLIPLAFAPILLTVLLDYKVSLVINFLNILLISVVVGFRPAVIILAITSVIIGSTTLKKIQQRNDVLYSTLYMSVISAIITLAAGMLISNNISGIVVDTGFSVLGALLSGVLALGFLPFFESSFDVVTNIKLLELSNPNQPLMKKLLMEAPGTYHHSMMVANLAEVAAEEVGGNPVVARIGAYYHDIGKTKRPYFFGENQMGKENPHNKITPNLSTLIIVSHTKDGVELAKEHNIPKVIQDIIEQHHGTTLVKYFYYTLKNSSENPDDVKEEDFRYPGPIPSSKEAAIIMLADGVEAAVRSITEPTKGKIEEMVNNIIKDKLYSDQLSNCDLTLKDIEIIRKCFLKVLNGIYHRRIEYPTEKKMKK
ncbi:HD family phosphohydrolase [Clostridium chauvoei]|uniref:HD family phosphohydrolase n=2 Tax=Clostridium chauvoei TaxID=46867 RepID=A0ABD4RFF1_9CLOT|nr:HD family phosphohydrolase [Clostridium chauvoei]ATD54704.1 phosphohydrolase [Clostridium chauvoei]ATD57614.1 phosphohydrolase [Clostridium chauvoei]MBX7280002.1 HD family phosphohydrolase [Clostridium chauvoei]MBX7282339.1 HD family phosphohydrolase [Clostridium chauvoei]MBX7284893.1 HD family phosphohydrolase [Clostridium chauvoei]